MARGKVISDNRCDQRALSDAPDRSPMMTVDPAGIEAFSCVRAHSNMSYSVLSNAQLSVVLVSSAPRVARTAPRAPATSIATPINPTTQRPTNSRRPSCPLLCARAPGAAPPASVPDSATAGQRLGHEATAHPHGDHGLRARRGSVDEGFPRLGEFGEYVHRERVQTAARRRRLPLAASSDAEHLQRHCATKADPEKRLAEVASQVLTVPPPSARTPTQIAGRPPHAATIRILHRSCTDPPRRRPGQPGPVAGSARMP